MLTLETKDIVQTVPQGNFQMYFKLFILYNLPVDQRLQFYDGLSFYREEFENFTGINCIFNED